MDQDQKLTVDSLCDAIRHFLRRAVVGHRDAAAPIHPELHLWGVPDDDVMKTVLGNGKRLTVIVSAIPQAVADAMPDEAVAANGAEVYEPVINRTVKPVESPLVPAEVAGQVAALEELGKKFTAWRSQFVPEAADAASE